MAGVYVNNQKSIYATDTKVNQIQAEIGLLARQDFKSNAGITVPNNLAVSNFVILEGYDASSVIQGHDQFSHSSGVTTYNGTETNYYIISYNISAITTTLGPITFAIFRDDTVLPASALVQHFPANIYESLSASVIIELEPGHSFSLRAELNSGTTSVLGIQNLKLSALKVAKV